jgi:hypothetical protein
MRNLYVANTHAKLGAYTATVLLGRGDDDTEALIAGPDKD